MPHNKEKEIILRSDEVNEILTSTPKWIFRWGISVIFILIIVCVALSYFIRYPDILTTNITLTTLNPPITLVSKNNGKLTYLLIQNKEQVKANQTIAVIGNTANYNDVLYLDKSSKELFDRLKLNDSIFSFVIKDNLRVGELTPFYLLVLKSIKDLIIYQERNPYNKQTKVLEKNLTRYTELLQKQRKQQTISNDDLKLAEIDYDKDKALFENNIIAARELDIKKKNYLSVSKSSELINDIVSNTIIQVNSIEKNILQLQILDYQEQLKFKNEFQKNLESLISEIIKWKQLYLIESPVNGEILFLNMLSANQNIKIGDKLFSIIPTQKMQLVGKCILPAINSGKLAIGQNVNIKLDNYPNNKNGILKGVITNISEAPDNGKYKIDVELKNGLTTTYNKTLTYKEDMKGKADIITANVSVMDQIFFSFKKLVDKR